MKFKYKLSKKNYEKIIRKTNSRNSIYYLILGSLVYLFLIKDLILENFLIMLVMYLVIVLFMFLSIEFVSIITSKLLAKINEKSLNIKYGTYECTLTKDKFIEKLEDSEISILLKDIVKTKKNKDNYEIVTGKMIVVFNKSLFENKEDYLKAVQFVEENKPKKITK